MDKRRILLFARGFMSLAVEKRSRVLSSARSFCSTYGREVQGGEMRIKYTFGEDGMGILKDCYPHRPIYVKTNCTEAHHHKCLGVDHPNHLTCMVFDGHLRNLICVRPQKTVAQYIHDWKCRTRSNSNSNVIVQYTIPAHPKILVPTQTVEYIHPFCRGVIKQILRYVVDVGPLKKFRASDIFMIGDTVKYVGVPFAKGHKTRASFEQSITCVLGVINELFGQEGPFPDDLAHLITKMRTGNYSSGQDLLHHLSIASPEEARRFIINMGQRSHPFGVLRGLAISKMKRQSCMNWDKLFKDDSLGHIKHVWEEHQYYKYRISHVKNIDSKGNTRSWKEKEDVVKASLMTCARNLAIHLNDNLDGEDKELVNVQAMLMLVFRDHLYQIQDFLARKYVLDHRWYA